MISLICMLLYIAKGSRIMVFPDSQRQPLARFAGQSRFSLLGLCFYGDFAALFTWKFIPERKGRMLKKLEKFWEKKNYF